MPRNARTHSEAQVAQIAGSIREFGFTNPVLVDGDNGIIAGHGRVLAARSSVIADGAITWSGRNVTVCGLHLVRHEIYSGQGYRNKGVSIEMNFQLSNRCNR